MVGLVSPFQIVLIQMGVDLGRTDIRVSQEFLNAPEVGTATKEMGGE